MNIKNGFNYAKKVISTGADMVVVLDEMLGLFGFASDFKGGAVGYACFKA